MMKEYIGHVKWFFLEQIDGIYFGDIIVAIFIAAGITFLPGYVLLIKNKTTIRKLMLSFITLLYAEVMLIITIFRRSIGSGLPTIHFYVDLGFTRHGIYSEMQTVYSVFNFFLFFFWGIIIGMHRRLQGILKIVFMTTLLGFISSFIIETLQFITKRGTFELTDLITNVTGAFCGAILVAIAETIYTRMNKK